MEGDEEDSGSESGGYRRSSRRINYCEDSNDSNVSDAPPQSKNKRPQGFLKHKNVLYSDDESEEEAQPRKRRTSLRYEEDSDYMPSDDESRHHKSSRSRKAAKGVKYRDSSSDGEYAPTKKSKGKLDLGNFVKSSGESETDNYFDEEEEEEEVEEDVSTEEDCGDSEEKVDEGPSAKLNGENTPVAAAAKVNSSLENSDKTRLPPAVTSTSKSVNGPKQDPSTSSIGSRPLVRTGANVKTGTAGQNGGFMIENLLKDSSSKAVVGGLDLVEGEEEEGGLTGSTGAEDLSDVASLSDVGELDLVDYVTQE